MEPRISYAFILMTGGWLTQLLQLAGPTYRSPAASHEDPGAKVCLPRLRPARHLPATGLKRPVDSCRIRFCHTTDDFAMQGVDASAFRYGLAYRAAHGMRP